MMEKTILSFEHVTGHKRRFSLQNDALRNFVLKDIHFTLKAGYIYGLVGENGAGKTTLMNYILKENIPYEGQIFEKTCPQTACSIYIEKTFETLSVSDRCGSCLSGAVYMDISAYIFCQKSVDTAHMLSGFANVSNREYFLVA